MMSIFFYLPAGFAFFSLVIWFVLTFFRGAFWQLREFDDDIAPHNNLYAWPSVVAVVPARNEAETMAHAVDSLVRQEYRGAFHVIVVDDHSEDSTGALAMQAAHAAGAADRFTVFQAAFLPDGWTGKVWAMQQGVDRGSSFAPDFYWFTDADITHSPDTLARLASRAESEKLALASLMVLLRAKSFAEKLLIPPFLYFFLKLYPPSWIANPRARTAGGAGGCVLLRRTAFDRIGGMAAIRAEVIDDCALARAVKGSGGKIWMGLTRRSVSLRAYESFAEIRDLIARTAFTQLGYSAILLVGTLLGMLLTYLLPVVFTFAGRQVLWRLGLAAWALMTVTYLPTVRFYGLSPLWAPTLPVAAAFYSYATWLSTAKYWTGKGGEWKGRSQAPKR